MGTRTRDLFDAVTIHTQPINGYTLQPRNYVCNSAIMFEVHSLCYATSRREIKDGSPNVVYSCAGIVSVAGLRSCMKLSAAFNCTKTRHAYSRRVFVNHRFGYIRI